MWSINFCRIMNYQRIEVERGTTSKKSEKILTDVLAQWIVIASQPLSFWVVDLISFSTADLFIANKGCRTLVLYLYSPSMQFRPVGLDLISLSIGHSLRACCRREFAFALIHFWQALLKVNRQNIGSFFCLTLVWNLGLVVPEVRYQTSGFRGVCVRVQVWWILLHWFFW